MTVPKSERNETSAEYIIHAENMRQDILSLTRRMPKRWDKDVIQDMRDMTRWILYHCVAANNIYASEEEEHSERLKHLTQAYAWCAVLIYDLNKVCEAVLSPDYTGQPPVWLENVKTQRIREIDASIKRERKLLKGVITKERDAYRAYRRKRGEYDDVKQSLHMVSPDGSDMWTRIEELPVLIQRNGDGYQPVSCVPASGSSASSLNNNNWWQRSANTNNDNNFTNTNNNGNPNNNNNASWTLGVLP